MQRAEIIILEELRGYTQSYQSTRSNPRPRLTVRAIESFRIADVKVPIMRSLLRIIPISAPTDPSPGQRSINTPVHLPPTSSANASWSLPAWLVRFRYFRMLNENDFYERYQQAKMLSGNLEKNATRLFESYRVPRTHSTHPFEENFMISETDEKRTGSRLGKSSLMNDQTNCRDL
jgi:hypothetical protein